MNAENLNIFLCHAPFWKHKYCKFMPTIPYNSFTFLSDMESAMKQDNFVEMTSLGCKLRSQILSCFVNSEPFFNLYISK